VDHSNRTARARIGNVVGHLKTTQAATLEHAAAASSRFKYTVDSNLLSDKQRKFYDENGFVVVKRLLPEADIAKFQARFLEICTGKVPSTHMTVMRDVTIAKKKEWGENSITKLQDWQEDEVLFDYCQHPEILKYVNAVIGPDVHSIHTMLINKPPDTGLGSSRHPPHQDLWYFPFRPAERIVCSWTAMQKIDKVNGCLFVQPGSHKGELFYHRYPSDGIVNRAYHGIQHLTEEDGKKMVHLEMEPGDTVFFHPLLIHGSGRNESKGYRKAISCHYAAAHCHFVEATGTIQEELAKELEDMAKGRMAKLGAEGVVLSFHDIWRLKNRHVSGEKAKW